VGKTLLALAAGLEQVFEPTSNRYDRLMILRPVVAVGRQELGFLPGDLESKLGPWFEAVVDAMVALGDNVSHRQAKDIIGGWVHEGKLTLEAVTYLRGRSLQHTYVLVDEVQNLEPSVAKTILTRLGQGSKAVLVGDTTQIDSPFLSERTNALSVLADSFAGEELFGHVALMKGERSAIADLAAARL
jgi:PhoH-like ATPase